MQDREVLYGRSLLFIGALQFVVFMAVVQIAFPCSSSSSCYSIFTNPISDLGNTSVSPFAMLFNYSIVLFGLLLIVGILYTRGAFRKSPVEDIGVASLIVAALGAMGVGVVPENTVLAVHSMFAVIAFLFGGVGMLLIGINDLEQKNGRLFSCYSIASGIVSIALLLASVSGIIHGLAMSGPGFGFGAVERAIVAPIILWVFVVSLAKRS
jgi:hypothetical membrane protein